VKQALREADFPPWSRAKEKTQGKPHRGLYREQAETVESDNIQKLREHSLKPPKKRSRSLAEAVERQYTVGV
jgi:hypothetical protein